MVCLLMISAEFSPRPRTPTRVSTLAKVFARERHRVIVLSNSGQLASGTAISSILKNLKPTKIEVDGVIWIFPPVFRTGSASTSLKALEGLLSLALTLIFGLILLFPYERGIEVIYTSTAQSQGFIGSCLKVLIRRPLVVNYGDPAFVRDTGIVRTIDKLLETITFSKSDLEIVLDPVIGEYVKRQHGKTAVFLPMPYDPDLFRLTDRRSPPRLKIITFLGKIDLSVYRLDILFEALRLLVDKFPNVRLRMIGDGPDVARLKHLATDLGLRESVEFVGLVPHKDVPRWLSESDTCVHVANDMCTATKVTEYMAARKPVVIAASWWNKYRQFLENGVNCVLVPLDAEKLAAAISHLLEDSLKAEQMAENGFKTMSLWTLKNMSDKKMALIEKLTRTA